MPSIIALAAAIFAFFATAMLIPLAAGTIYGEWRAVEGFAAISVSYGFLSTIIIMTLAPRLRRLSRAGVFTATVTMWFSLVFAAIPAFMLIENAGPVEAIFEAVSAATTLGTTLRPVAEMSSTMILYRGLVAWQGGLLTLLLAVYVLGRYEIGGTPNRHLRYILHSFQSGDPRVVQTFFEVFVPYLALTLMCAAALVIARTNPADALNVALNITSTNGFLPLNTGASVLNNAAGEIVLMVFMLLAATSIIWHRTLSNRRWRQAAEQSEMSAYLGFVAAIVLIGIFVSLIAPQEDLSGTESVLGVAFDLVSVMTTTGITHDPRFGIGLPFELILVLALVGGCSYSTAGGIKMFRLVAMLHHSANEIRRLVFPHIVLAHSVDLDPVEKRNSSAVWGAFYVSLVTIVLATIILSLQGIDLAAGLGIAVGTFSSTGNLVSQSLAASGQQDPSRIVMLSIAILGVVSRIEIVVLLAAIVRTR